MLSELRRLSDSINNASRSFSIAGHVGVGLHEFLKRDVHYFTFLRDPVQRTISTYYHQKRWGFDLSLIDWVKSAPRLSFNLQTRFLSGYEFNSQLNGQWDEESFYKDDQRVLDEVGDRNLGLAIDQLNGNLDFGLTEDYNASLVLLKLKYKWRFKDLIYRRRNRGFNKPKDNILTGDELSLIRKYNLLDIQLYERARNLYSDRKNDIYSKSPLIGAQVSLLNTLTRALHLLLPVKQKGPLRN